MNHLNCMTFSLGVRGITHCLLVETRDGLVLVDTGLGTADYEQRPRHARILIALNKVPCDMRETAISQVTDLGYSPEDVRHIVLTHMHADHSGGLPDFPWARVHVYAREYEAAMHPGWFSFFDQVGIQPAHWAHGPQWEVHQGEYRRWLGLDCIPVIGTEGRGILLVPLPGHTLGHCGVAVATDSYWLLHCGDAFVRDCQVDPLSPRSPFPIWLRAAERAVFPVGAQERLRGLLRSHSDEVRVFCSHDPVAYAELRGISIDEAVGLSALNDASGA